jgi:hypothetical protein
LRRTAAFDSNTFCASESQPLNVPHHRTIVQDCAGHGREVTPPDYSEQLNAGECDSGKSHQKLMLGALSSP